MAKMSVKDKRNKVKNKRQTSKSKEKRTRFLDIKDAELLSKHQLKKIKQNRTCATMSGKRKHKLLKRIRHQQREKIRMDVEPEAPKKQTTKKDQSSSKTMEVDS